MSIAEKETNANTPAPRSGGLPSGPRYRTSRVHRTGNSYAIYLPKAIVTALGVDEFREVKVYVVGDVICLQPARQESFVPHVIGVRR